MCFLHILLYQWQIIPTPLWNMLSVKGVCVLKNALRRNFFVLFLVILSECRVREYKIMPASETCDFWHALRFKIIFLSLWILLWLHYLFVSVKRNSNFAAEALAGLASKEDITSVSLRKPTLLSSYLPFKDLMLLHVKGRRHVQTRLVEPTASSINKGDNYLLITPSTIYNYIGEFSNVIEQSRAADIANYIQQTKDMGCKIGRIVTINSKDPHTTRKDTHEFWKLLKSSEDSVVDAGHPEEDELYEMRIIGTNMIYEFCNDELVPYTEYWA